MCAVPAATAVTTPTSETVATAEFVLAHVTTRSVSTLPSASRTSAVAGVLCPGVSVGAPMETMTAATGGGGAGRMVNVTLALVPSAVAVIVTVPGPTAVITPPGYTVATVGSLVSQVTGWPVTMLPSASRATADTTVASPAWKP